MEAVLAIKNCKTEMFSFFELAKYAIIFVQTVGERLATPFLERGW